jgi:hypothetical protein
MTTKTDTYNYAQSPLSGNYITASDKGLQSTVSGAHGVSGAIRDNVTVYNPAVYQFLPAHISTITFGNTPTADDWAGTVAAGANSGGIAGGGQGYLAYYEPEASAVSVFVLSATIANSITSTGSYILHITSVTFGSGDTLGLGISGTTLTAYKNGSSIGTVNDTTYTGGQPGLAYEFGGSNGTLVSSWTGTDAAGGGPTPSAGGLVLAGAAPIAIRGTVIRPGVA